VQRIRFPGRKKKAQENEISAPEEAFPQHRQRKLIHPNFLYKILLERYPRKRNFLKRNLLKRTRYLKIMRSQ
jgi:hypothetical protein